MTNVTMPDLGQTLRTALQRTEREALARIEAQAKLTAPVDTGYFRAQIKAEYGSGQVVANANYSAALEYGVQNTRRQPRPTMRNAARKVSKQISAIFERNFK